MTHSSQPRRGVVLLLVLVVIMVLALAAYTFSDLMLTHYEAVEHNGREIQSRALVDSGVETIRMFLLLDEATRNESGGIYDNPLVFQGLPVLLDSVTPERSGCATIVAPALDDDGNLAGLRFGLEDESARINLNALVSLFDNPAAAVLLQGVAEGQGAGGGSGNSGSGGTTGGASTGGSSGNTGASSGGNSGSTGGNTGGSSGSSGGSTGLMSTLAGAASAMASEEGEEEPISGARDLLLTLPGMDEYIADAILDWIDEDDEPREFGCEIEYYSGLSPPYAPRNAPLITVEELLLVRDVTPELLYGLDQNRNGTIDPNELQNSAAGGASGAEAVAANLGAQGSEAQGGSLDRGWSSYFTLHGMEKNFNSLGEQRIDLNNQDLQALFDQLSLVFSEEQVTFIVAYRMAGEYTGEEDGKTTSGELDLSSEGGTRINSVLDLIDKKVSVQFEGDDEATVLAPAFPLALAGSFLPNLMDNVTINPAATIPGRVSINQAPRSILMGIPSMNEEIVTAIIDARRDIDPAATDDLNWQHETWPLVEGIVSLDEMKMLAPFICAGGDVYRAQVVGYYQDGEASSRAEVIVDATGDLPRVVFWRDISHLGRGYSVETLGAMALPGY
jgi:type II secretory pathway component PulK